MSLQSVALIAEPPLLFFPENVCESVRVSQLLTNSFKQQNSYIN